MVIYDISICYREVELVLFQWMMKMWKIFQENFQDQDSFLLKFIMVKVLFRYKFSVVKFSVIKYMCIKIYYDKVLIWYLYKNIEI